MPHPLAPTLIALALPGLVAAQPPAAQAQLARGRYMVVTGQCNNCHTAGYSASQGALPEAQWLLGDRRGRREPEGVVYAGRLTPGEAPGVSRHR
jgi:mono/diheme cytochrome c family protein